MSSGQHSNTTENLRFDAGFISGGFFLVSMVILAHNPQGVLNGPGIAIAGLGLILAYRKFYAAASIVGVMTSSTSLILQSLTAVCASCTAAALAFALAGLSLLFRIWPRRPIFTSSLAGVLVGAVVCFAFPGLFSYTEGTPYYSITRLFPENTHYSASLQSEKNGINHSKAHLYISMTCPACQNVLPAFISTDPDGDKWIPVIVPSGFADEERAWLSELGYRGNIEGEVQSPTGAVPSLIWDGNQYIGEAAIIESSFLINSKGTNFSAGGGT